MKFYWKTTSNRKKCNTVFKLIARPTCNITVKRHESFTDIPNDIHSKVVEGERKEENKKKGTPNRSNSTKLIRKILKKSEKKDKK